jgi:hypothetical protein
MPTARLAWDYMIDLCCSSTAILTDVVIALEYALALILPSLKAKLSMCWV